jgi:hypothetical protein
MYYTAPHLRFRGSVKQLWRKARIRLFMTLGIQLFGYVATWPRKGRKIHVIHFAVSLKDLRSSCRDLANLDCERSDTEQTR